MNYMADVVLLVDDLKLLSGIPRCRICHEEEFESIETLEAPCACSGTVKVNTKYKLLNLKHLFLDFVNNLLCFARVLILILLNNCVFVGQFAHRDCIQRWCNEKGNTTCEICLQV